MLIYNPRAGKVIRTGGALIERAGKILKQQGHNLTVAPTTGPRIAGDMAREHIAQGADLIVVAGGDGTINETAEGMLGTRGPTGDSAGGYGQRPGHGNEAGPQPGARGGAFGRPAAAADFGGACHLRRRAGVAALPADGGNRSGRARGLQGQARAEGQDGKVRVLGGGLDAVGQEAPGVRRGDRRAEAAGAPSHS